MPRRTSDDFVDYNSDDEPAGEQYDRISSVNGELLAMISCHLSPAKLKDKDHIADLLICGI